MHEQLLATARFRSAIVSAHFGSVVVTRFTRPLLSPDYKREETVRDVSRTPSTRQRFNRQRSIVFSLGFPASGEIREDAALF